MSIRQKDLKLLWGRAANRCSVCKAELSYDAATCPSAYPLGEQAHIVAEEESGPRGRSTLSAEDRNSYFNLMLLCPTHHTLVDTAVKDYPIERLHLIKDQHELWVRERLAAQTDDPTLLLYSHVVDILVEGANLAEWDLWVGHAISVEHHWPADTKDRFFDLFRAVQKAAWPGTLLELERASTNLAAALIAAANVFLEHCESAGDRLRADRFYKRADSEIRYHALVDVFEAWSSCCDELLREATRAANWFADAVRAHLNPLFFLLEGRFSVTEQVGLGYRSSVHDYTQEERMALPEALPSRIIAACVPYRDAQARLNEMEP